ncbi:MAG: POTRA domain-containing protein, partial [Candidatus Zixiibacteriota bacterium]
MAVLFILSAGAGAQTELDRETLRWINQEPKIKSIDISGNHFFTDSKIKSILFSQEYSFFSNVKNSRNVRLRRETLVRDTSAVKGLYLQAGFLGVRVRETFGSAADSSAQIRIEI